jgi:putative spermidine/putrescine transport system permease protein
VSAERRTLVDRLLLLYFCAVIALLVLPIAIIAPVSFSTSQFMRFPPTKLGLRWYEAYLGSAVWIDATLRSLRIATGASLIATLLGSSAAIALERGRLRGRTTLSALFSAPAIVPHVIVALGVFIMTVRVGLNDTEVGLVLAHAVFGLPFVVLIVASSLRQIDPTLERAARVLGAGPWRAFLTGTLPPLLPAVVASVIFAFFISFDELIVALFVMGEKQTLPVRIWSDLRFELNPTIAAISTLMVVLTTVAMVLAEMLRRRSARRLETHLAIRGAG